MPDILHRIAVKNLDPAEVISAVATPAGISSWWIGETSGSTGVGTKLSFGGDIEATIVEQSATRVVWEITKGADEWIGTTVEFDVKPDGDYTVVLFTHRGWREAKEFMHHCSTKWGVFMLSLKARLETGTGTPTPHDPHIDNWS